MSTPDRKPDTCKHPGIVTYAIADEGPDHGQPAGLWACRVCGHKFVPLDLEMEARAALSEPALSVAAPEFCCEHAWSAAKQLAWKERDLRCDCDHNEYCPKCWPLEFRAGGKWDKYIAAPSPALPARTPDERAADKEHMRSMSMPAPPARVALSDEQIARDWERGEWFACGLGAGEYAAIVRSVERHHGITERMSAAKETK